MKKGTTSQTQTVLEEKILEKAKNKLYLVLKKKGFAEKIIDEINSEMEKRFAEIFKKSSAKLNEMKFDNPVVALECFLLKKMVKILDDIIKEILPNLSEKDKKAIFDLLEKNDNEKKDDAP